MIDLSNFRRAPLWDQTTALEPQHNLAQAVGAAQIYAKRDDCNGLAFGGNKVRQLEYYIGEALNQGADTVMMTGAVQSNFVRTAAAACNKHGLACHIQLEERVPKDDLEYKTSGNVLLDQFLGATLHSFPEGENEAAADANLQRIADGLSAEGKVPYIVPMHPSHAPLGALGYVHAAEELVSQFSELNIRPDHIFVGSGSGNTHSGLLVGLRLLGCHIPVVGVCVRRPTAEQQPRMEARCQQLIDLLGVPSPLSKGDVITRDDHLAPGYGRAGPEAVEAIKLGASKEGLILDPVYTGKVMAGLVASSRATPDQILVFVHSGGGPAIFGYATDIRDMV